MRLIGAGIESSQTAETPQEQADRDPATDSRRSPVTSPKEAANPLSLLRSSSQQHVSEATETMGPPAPETEPPVAAIQTESSNGQRSSPPRTPQEKPFEHRQTALDQSEQRLTEDEETKVCEGSDLPPEVQRRSELSEDKVR